HADPPVVLQRHDPEVVPADVFSEVPVLDLLHQQVHDLVVGVTVAGYAADLDHLVLQRVVRPECRRHVPGRVATAGQHDEPAQVRALALAALIWLPPGRRPAWLSGSGGRSAPSASW